MLKFNGLISRIALAVPLHTVPTPTVLMVRCHLYVCSAAASPIAETLLWLYLNLSVVQVAQQVGNKLAYRSFGVYMIDI